MLTDQCFLAKTKNKNTQEMPQHEEQPSRDTKRRRDEEQIMTKLTPRMEPQIHKQRTAVDEPP